MKIMRVAIMGCCQSWMSCRSISRPIPGGQVNRHGYCRLTMRWIRD